MKRILLLAMIVAACDRAEAPPAETASGTTATPVVASGDSVVGRWRAKVPDSLLLRKGACPFECCVYSDWALRDSAVVQTAPQVDAPTAFVLPDSTVFHADSGFVRIAKIQLVVVHDTLDQRPDAKLFVPGDTLVVLDYVGEGHWKVLTDGRVLEVEGFWGAEQAKPVSEMLGSYEAQWWAHVTMKDGRKGWLNIRPPMYVIGADKCGGPPYWKK